MQILSMVRGRHRCQNCSLVLEKCRTVIRSEYVEYCRLFNVHAHAKLKLGVEDEMVIHLGLKSSTFGHGRSHGGGAQKPVGKGKATDVNSVVRGDISKGTRKIDLESSRGFKRAFKVRIGTGKNAEERWVIDLAGAAGPG